MLGTKPENLSKKLQSMQCNNEVHWVGNGFPVRTLFSYPDLGATISPFLLFDYAGPKEFPPTEKRLGVGEHPHRGFETVTIIYSGEVEHRDSSGGSGKIGPGDVQWMTAASGLVHDEFHSQDFARQGGTFEVVQLWINLPAKDKISPPRYQDILNNQIPFKQLSNGQGSIRVIAGKYDELIGPAMTFTPIHLWDLRLENKKPFNLAVPDGYSTLLAVLRGAVQINNSQTIKAAEVGVFDRTGDHIRIENSKKATALLLCGKPINEPIVGSGPFVMNTQVEISRAIADFQSGKMGHVTP